MQTLNTKSLNTELTSVELTPQEKKQIAFMFLRPGLKRNPRRPRLPEAPVQRRICLEIAAEATSTLLEEQTA